MSPTSKKKPAAAPKSEAVVPEPATTEVMATEVLATVPSAIETQTTETQTTETLDTLFTPNYELDGQPDASREFASGMNAFMGGAARLGSRLLRREPSTSWQTEALDRPALPDFGIAGGAAELRGDDITAWFGDHKVLDRVSLTMEAGKVTALIGPSGCGKSTFLRILNRMHEMVPSAALAGQVFLADEDIYAPDQRVTYARRNIGMVFQKANPFPAMSIYENTIAGLELCGIKATRSEKDYLVEDSLRKASLWEEVKDRLYQPGAGLSGGQQQRLCIARALAISPRVLLMDEPCSALDPTSTRRVEDTIAELRGQVTIVIVTHNMQQAARVSDQCAFFLAAQNTPGVIVEHGDTTAMFNNPQDERTSDYVGGRFG